MYKRDIWVEGEHREDDERLPKGEDEYYPGRAYLQEAGRLVSQVGSGKANLPQAEPQGKPGMSYQLNQQRFPHIDLAAEWQKHRIRASLEARQLRKCADD